MRRWWLTVGWDKPSGAVRSQTHASPSGADWIRLSRRRRAGSASAFKTPASRSASCFSIGSPASGEIWGIVISANAVPTYFILPPGPSTQLHICLYESVKFSSREAEVSQRESGSIFEAGGAHSVTCSSIDDNRYPHDLSSRLSERVDRCQHAT